jgi:hypothetical protein
MRRHAQRGPTSRPAAGMVEDSTVDEISGGKRIFFWSADSSTTEVPTTTCGAIPTSPATSRSARRVDT